jgi:hypothetical protein
VKKRRTAAANQAGTHRLAASTRLSGLGAALVLALAVLVLAPATAGAAQMVISGNPMRIVAQDVGNLQANVAPVTQNVFYPPSSDAGNAGLFIGFPVDTGTGPAISAGTTYGPVDTHFTAVSQSAVTGSGTMASPFSQDTTYKVMGSDGKDYLQVVQTITYVNGTSQFVVTYKITNVTGTGGNAASSTPLRFRVSEAADTYIAGDDRGIGYFSAGPPRFVGGFNPNAGSAGGILETGTPLWSHYQEDVYSTIFSLVGSPGGGGFMDSINQNLVDNGMGVQWDDHYNAGSELAAGQTATYALTWKFGIGGLFQLTLTPTSASATTGQTVPFTATLKDFNGHPVNNGQLHYAVAGANPSSGTATTNSAGQAVLSLSGGNPGNDGLLAFADLNGNGTRDPGEPLAAATIAWTQFSVPTTKAAADGKIKITATAPEAGAFTANVTFEKNAKGQVVAGQAPTPVVYGTATASTTHAGPVTLTVNPTKAARKALKKKHHFSVTVHLSFRSSAHLGSSTATKDFKIKVHKGKH